MNRKASVPYSRPAPRFFSAVGSAQVCQPLVAEKPAGETGQNRRKGSKWRQVCPFRDGGSRRAPKTFQAHPAANQ